MEILQIKSSHDLTARTPGSRPAGAHSYAVNCRQFISAQSQWQKTRSKSPEPLCVMTLRFERIWITAQETEQVAAAIKATRPVVSLEGDVAEVQPAAPI